MGVNPKSLANLKPGQNKRKTAKRTTLLLEEETIAIAQALDDKLGRGIDAMAKLIEKNYCIFIVTEIEAVIGNPHDAGGGVYMDIYHKPWKISQKGNIVQNPRKCLINGIEIRPNTRVLVRGKTHESLPRSIKKQYGDSFEFVLGWDGSTLTEFPDAEYVLGAKKNNCPVIEI